MSYAELATATNFSFLHGASHPSEMVEAAIALGHSGIGIADRNSVAGVVRAWSALSNAREEGRGLDFKLISGARLVFADGTPDIIAYPITRRGWGRLTRLLSLGNLRTVKGSCELYVADLLEWAEEMALIVLPFCGFAASRELRKMSHAKPQSRKEDAVLLTLRDKVDHLWIGARMNRAGRDKRHLARLKALSTRTHIPLVAVNDALYATPEQRPLHDILTCIAQGTTIGKAGRNLLPNAERHLKPPSEMARLFSDAPEAIATTQDVLGLVGFDLGELAYEYPHEPIPQGYTPQAWLEELVMEKALARWPEGLPANVQALLDEEFHLVGKMNYAAYFLTVHDIVQFAQGRNILCQGRGSAANSMICFVLGITAVDPAKHNLLFSRFISEERKEPPDIDVDFEHERREEVMQYIYARYGRDRAGIVATVIHYRPRSAVREVGKALGLSEDVTQKISSTVWGSYSSSIDPKRFAESGFDPDNPDIARMNKFVQQILKFPRHLSQHVGGFVLTQDRLDETVPIHNAAMADRTFIEWDKDDIDALGLMKVDVLALGMLTCIRKAFDMIGGLSLDTIPDEDEAVFDMLCKGDSVGVFQVESRAQINMLPRLRPREFYDLAIQVAIVRPGPIQGDMVHPYLRRRQGREAVDFPSPAPPHNPNELREVLGKTLGVPLFQEQAMKLAIVAAEFTPSESNQLRRAMATFRNLGTIDAFREKLVGGMVSRGYQAEFAERCFKQIEGFGSYGFPESHAIAFARLVWVSSWLKCHYPAVFAAALLNSQPMGFYAPAQIVRDAREHGVAVRGVDVNLSDWDNRVSEGALTLGLRQIDSFREIWAESITAHRPFVSIEDLARRTAFPARALRLLADADAFRSLGLDRREALWEVRRTHSDTLPLFAAADARELAEEPAVNLPTMALGEHVAADYQTIRLSLKAHPLHFLRAQLTNEGILSCQQTAAAKNGARVKTAGVVLVRQRPGNGNAIFLTLEDESGITNVVIWARLFERYRRAVMASRLMLVEGELQRSPEGVIHLMASRIYDRTADLARLSETHETNPALARADEVVRPQHPRRSSHPRNVRILPKSRDFH
ncbi:MAG: error-prone DNA polymerase [Sphingomonadaceae bacterium]